MASALSRKFRNLFWQFIMSQERCKMYQNSNIEIRNPKQYQNPNVQNSKQKRDGIGICVSVIGIFVIRIFFVLRYSNFGFPRPFQVD